MVSSPSYTVHHCGPHADELMHALVLSTSGSSISSECLLSPLIWSVHCCKSFTCVEKHTVLPYNVLNPCLFCFSLRFSGNLLLANSRLQYQSALCYHTSITGQLPTKTCESEHMLPAGHMKPAYISSQRRPFASVAVIDREESECHHYLEERMARFALFWTGCGVVVIWNSGWRLFCCNL